MPNAPAHAPPAHGWRPLSSKATEADEPMLRIFRGDKKEEEVEVEGKLEADSELLFSLS